MHSLRFTPFRRMQMSTNWSEDLFDAVWLLNSVQRRQSVVYLYKTFEYHCVSQHPSCPPTHIMAGPSRAYLWWKSLKLPWRRQRLVGRLEQVDQVDKELLRRRSDQSSRLGSCRQHLLGIQGRPQLQSISANSQVQQTDCIR